MRIAINSVSHDPTPDNSDELVTVKFTLTLGNNSTYTDETTYPAAKYRAMDQREIKRSIIADIALRYRLSNEILGAFTQRTDEKGNRILPARNSRDHLRELLYQQEAIATRAKKNISALQLFSMAESTQLMATILDTATDKEFAIIERTGATVHPEAFPDVVAQMKKERAQQKAVNRS